MVEIWRLHRRYELVKELTGVKRIVSIIMRRYEISREEAYDLTGGMIEINESYIPDELFPERVRWCA